MCTYTLVCSSRGERRVPVLAALLPSCGHNETLILKSGPHKSEQDSLPAIMEWAEDS